VSSRDEILKRINRNLPQSSPLPTLDEAWTVFEDPVATFVETVPTVGGAAVVVENLDEARQHLETLPAFAAAKKVCSLVPELHAGDTVLNDVEDPHKLEDLDFAIVHSSCGVAENGAVWMETEGVKHRVLFFIAQHLVTVLPAAAIVSNQHQAYDWLPATNGPSFQVQISGPSKTADIEQSLVIGAHGPRSHTVYVLREQS